MTIQEKNEIGHTLAGKFYGMCDGSRIYKVCRGFFQVQDSTRPNHSSYNGTKREIERAMGHAITKMNY
jgi:hypothetical protein